jgi:hypothetical protein
MWAVCEVWVDRCVEEEAKGGVKGPLLMKQKKRGKITLSFTSPEKEFVFLYL